MIYFLVFQKSHGYEKCACFLDLSKIVRCQRTASKHGDYFEFSLFEDDKKSSKFFHVKSVSFFTNILVCTSRDATTNFKFPISQMGCWAQ